MKGRKSCTHLFVEYFEILQALIGDGEQADEALLRAHGHLSVRAVLAAPAEALLGLQS